MTATDETPAPKQARKRAATGARKKSQVRTGKRQPKVTTPLGPLPAERDRITDARVKHPWGLIRTDYIEGVPNANGEIDYPTLEAIAKKWNVSVGMVKNRSTEEQWGKRREMAQAVAAAERRRERMKELAGMSSDIDEKSIKLSQLGLGLVTSRMAEIARDAAMRRTWQAQRERMLESGRLPDASDQGPPPVDSRELGTLASAATTWHALGRQALGDDVTHIEISGPDGGPIGVVNAHLAVDDPDRLVDVVAAMQRSGILNDIIESGHVVDGTVVSDVTDPVHHDEEADASPESALEALVGAEAASTLRPGESHPLALPDGMPHDVDPEVLAQHAADIEAEYDIAD